MQDEREKHEMSRTHVIWPHTSALTHSSTLMLHRVAASPCPPLRAVVHSLLPHLQALRCSRASVTSRLLSSAMSRQTTLPFAKPSEPATAAALAAATAGHSTQAVAASADVSAGSHAAEAKQQPSSNSSSSGGGSARGEKRKGSIALSLEELNRLFGSTGEASAGKDSAAASSAAAAASSSSSSSAPLSAAEIRRAYDRRHHDMQKTLDDLIDQTGRHRELHSSFVHTGEDDGRDGEGAGAGESASKRPRSARACIEEKKGDLFSCDASTALAHCVSVDLAMGRGIAVQFKNRFGHVAALKAQKQGVGGLAVLKHENRWVYYLITKPRYWDKPTYESLSSSLRAMREHMRAQGVTHVAMPRIGCGLDGLLWGKVHALLKEIFADSDVVVTVYTL